LLVEDSEVDRWFAGRALQSLADVEFNFAKDGQQAIDYLLGRGEFSDRTQFPLPDIILLDLKMPHVSGFDFLRWRREKAPETLSGIPVVVLSGSDMDQDVSEAFTLGASRYMVKTSDLQLSRRRLEALAELYRNSELAATAPDVAVPAEGSPPQGVPKTFLVP
jgi:CheY-like chemotaxis protein